MLSANDILARMEELATDYETARRILDQYEPLYEALHDETLQTILTGKTEDFSSAENKEIMETAVISKLTINEKTAMVRAENPRLADKVLRTKAVMKRIEKQFDMWSSQLIYHQSALKHEIAVGNHRP